MTDHEFVLDRIAEYLAGGLPDQERSQLESHVADCESCAAEFAAAQQTEKTMTHLFASIAPPTDFEDRLLSRLRFRGPRLRISPSLRRAAIAASVALALGGIGYVMNQRIQNGTLPLLATATSAPNPGDYYMGGHVQRVGVYNLSGRKITLKQAEVVNAPSEEPFANSAAQWDVGGGANTNLGWSNWPDDRKNSVSGSASHEAGLMPTLSPAPAAESVYPKIASKDVPVDQSTTETQAYRRPMGNSGGTTFYTSTGGVLDAPKGSQVNTNRLGGLYFKPADKMLADAAPAPHQTEAAQIAQGIAGGLPTDSDGDKEKTTSAPTVAPIRATLVARNPSSGQTTSPDTESTVAPSTQPSQKIIRNGEMEFEVDSFDSAAATISKVVGEEGGAVVTVNSDKLANGKVKGTVTVRVAPDHLDALVMKLRALGDLKRQNLTAQDVTKEYTDTASELRADRAMEERLLNIIKTSQGQVKDLLAVEKELATWREKIEKAEGEIRYYDNLVAMSTLTIQITERDIKTAAAATESENVDMGVEADDVEAARSDAIKAINDAGGRITDSELKKLDAGQLAAKIVAELKPDSAGPATDRLKQLGRVARLEITRQQTTIPGATPDSTTKLQKGDTHLILSLYNVANIAPRQTTIVNLAADDVEQSYQATLAAINKANGRIVTSNLNRQTDQQTGGTIQAEVKSADADAVVAAIKALGEVVRLNAVENPDTNNVTNAKRGINIELSSLASMLPREINYRAIACADVAKSRQAMLDILRPMKPRIVVSKLDDHSEGKLNGYLDFEIRRADVPTIEKALTAAGETYDRKVDTSDDANNVTDAKVQFKVQFAQATALPPKQSDTLAVEVSDVDAASQSIQNDATAMGGHIVDSSSSKDANAQTARLVLEVPLSHAAEILSKTHQLGIVQTNQQSTNAQAPSGELGREHLELTLSSRQSLVSDDHGIFASLRHGFAISFAGLMWSLELIVIGLCFVLPWALLIWGVTRLLRRRKAAILTATT